VRMRQCAHGARFIDEMAFAACPFKLVQVGAESLDGEVAAENGIMREIDAAYRTAPKLPGDIESPEATDGRTSGRSGLSGLSSLSRIHRMESGTRHGGKDAGK
jgi:hypothetical protein